MSKLKLKDYFRIHFDIPSLTVILLIILIIYRPAAILFLKFVQVITRKIDIPQWVKDVVINVSSEIIGALIIALIIFLYLKLTSKPFFAGKYKAYEKIEKDGGVEVFEEWGTINLTYNIFFKSMKGTLVSTDGSVKFKLSGEIDKERYFKGTYIQQDKPSALRLGAFLMLVNPYGESYEGMFLHFSPTTTITQPEKGFAKWVRIN
jgi:hypothetical protein